MAPMLAKQGRSRKTPSMKKLALSAVLATALLSGSGVRGQAINEPPGNQVYFGAWIDTAVSDTAEAFNQRLGFNASVFQIAQNMPLPVYNYTTGGGGPAPEKMIELSGTTADVFLTVYPSGGFGILTQADFDVLAEQVSVYSKVYKRHVYIRFAPEMQGTWNAYGQQPTAFISAYRQLYATVKAAEPEAIMIWAPNTGQGYPFGQGWGPSNSVGSTSPQDQQLLDTNGNGELDADDDPYAPYYPGDEYVDWLGISAYYKGPESSDHVNRVQDPGFCTNIINGVNPITNRSIVNFYENYCNKANKACMFTESGAAFHVDEADSGASQVDIQREWIQSCITNTSFYDEFPRVKMVMHFEYLKDESRNDGEGNDLRDYRLTNATDVLSMFQENLSTASSRIAWATYSSPPPPSALPSNGQLRPSSSSQASGGITATYRERPTNFPSLFGASPRSVSVELAHLVIVSLACILGSVMVLRLI